MINVTYYNVLICVIVSLGAYGYGFGFGVFVGSIGQPGFYRDMHLETTGTYTEKCVHDLPHVFGCQLLIIVIELEFLVQPPPSLPWEQPWARLLKDG
jgi:hypothetical protein